MIIGNNAESILDVLRDVIPTLEEVRLLEVCGILNSLACQFVTGEILLYLASYIYFCIFTLH